jgi:hypothetical protein
VQHPAAEGGVALFLTPPAIGPTVYWLGTEEGSLIRIDVLERETPVLTTAVPLDPSTEVLTLANTGEPESSPARRCVFPFTYMGRSYTSCTCAVIGRFWCSTTDDFDLDDEWGLCDPDSAFDPSAQPCETGSFALRVAHPTSPADAYARFDDLAEDQNSDSGSAESGVAAGVAAGAVGAALVILIAMAVLRRHFHRSLKIEEMPLELLSDLPPSRTAFAPTTSRAGMSERAVYIPHLTKSVV